MAIHYGRKTLSALRQSTQRGNGTVEAIEVLNVKVPWGYPYYYFSRHYQIAAKIKPLYFIHYACYLTSNTTGEPARLPDLVIKNIFYVRNVVTLKAYPEKYKPHHSIGKLCISAGTLIRA
jgi:hypothetical protein